jgi:hypothetical protein
MSKNIAALLAVALLSISCSDDSPTAPTQTPTVASPSVRVAGRVIDYRTGQGVSGLTINWSTPNPGSHLVAQSLTSTSDATGRYEVIVPITDGFTPLADTLLAQIPQALAGVRIPGKSLETDLLANSGPCAGRYGYVYDAVTRLPVAGAQVRRAGTATTDANGYYRIDIGCEPKDYTYWGIGTTIIEASHPAYAGAFEFDGRREGTSYSGLRRVDFALQPKP